MEGRQRIDKWLWVARFVRTRSQAADLVSRGQIRLNRVKIVKPSHEVGKGDVLTIALQGRVRVVEVSACALRRGPSQQALLLYQERAMPESDGSMPQKGDAPDGGTC